MCLIVFAVNVIDGYPLVVAPTAMSSMRARPGRFTDGRTCRSSVAGIRRPAAPGWKVSAEVPGRFAAVTNVRDGDPVPNRTNAHAAHCPSTS